MFHKSFLSNHLSVFNSEAATGGVLSGVCFGGFRGVHWGGAGCAVAGGGVAGSGAGIFQLVLWNFWEHLFCRAPPDDCFC